MLNHILKRLILLIPVLLGVTVFVFTILYFAPGDPAQVMLGDSATPEAVAELRQKLGLDDPLPVQLINYIGGIVRCDFGTSYVSKGPVFSAIITRYPTTMLLASLSVLCMVVIGVPIGIISATKQYSVIDNMSMGIALVGVSMPTFWIAMLSVLLFALRLEWLPVSGFYGPKYWILPAFAIGFHGAAMMARMTRSSMLEVIRQDYIRTARAKGQIENKVIIHHALRNALIPIITVIGLQLGMQLGGAMVIESIFSIPGLGGLMLSSIKARDFPVVMGGVILIAFSFTIINLIIDIVYGLVDPRIKGQYKSKRSR